MDFSFSHLSRAAFDDLVEKVRAISNIEDEDDVGTLKISARNKTIRFSGAFRGGGDEMLIPFFRLIATHLDASDGPDHSQTYYVSTYSDQSEESYLQEDSEAIRYVIGPGYVAEQRMYVSAPYGEYVLLGRDATKKRHGIEGSADLDKFLEGMRRRIKIWEVTVADREERPQLGNPKGAASFKA
ncbi:MAG: hypothetical protein M3T56_06170 [Chloroflexota bacterium]|nr:hypothetical protein [Chloroflexota bacterium]